MKTFVKKPYWTFTKVVLAGWLIRYPKQSLKIIGLPIGFLLAIIYSKITGN